MGVPFRVNSERLCLGRRLIINCIYRRSDPIKNAFRHVLCYCKKLKTAALGFRGYVLRLFVNHGDVKG